MRIIPYGLNRRLILLISCILFATGVSNGWISARQQSELLISSMQKHSAVMVRNFSDRCAYFLVLEDFAGLESFLKESVDLPPIHSLQVCDPDGTVVSDVEIGQDNIPHVKQGSTSLFPPKSLEPTITPGIDSLVIWHPIQAGNLLGWIKATYNLSLIRKAQSETLKKNLLLSLLWILCSTVLLLIILRPLVKAVKGLTSFARELDTNKGGQTTVSLKGTEIEELNESLNYASTRLYLSEEELIREKTSLKEQYSTLSGIIESTSERIFSVNKDYRYTSFNTAYTSMVKDLYGVDIQPGQSLLETINVTEDQESAKRNLDRTLAGESHMVSFSSGKEPGAKRYFEVSYNPITSGTNTVIGVAVYSRDITKRKRAENELQRLNRELRALSNCNQAMIRADDESELLDHICRIICEEAGYRMVWVGYAVHDDGKTVRPAAHAGFENGYLDGADITWAETEHGKGPTGTAIRTGKPVSIPDFCTDPHATPWREKAIARDYRSSISLPLKDESYHTFGALNIYSSEPNTFTPDEIRLLEDLGNDLAFGITALRTRIKHLEAEESLRQLNEELEERVLRRTRELGQSRDELQTAYNELKIAQSRILQQEKMATIGQLAAGVAHEINNPMGFILSNLNTLRKYTGRLIEFQNAQETALLQLARQSVTEATEVEELKKMKKSLKIKEVTSDIDNLVMESIEGGERIKKIVQNLKSFARLDENKLKLTDLNQCIESTLNMVWNELKYNCTVVKEYGDIAQISCNPSQLNQVFMNLLVNAGQAIEAKGEIKITTRHEKGSVYVTIEDTGCGIPADKLSRIFDPFFTTKEVGKGTGLGLSIVYDIIKSHKGEIAVKSEIGCGTSFTIRLPDDLSPDDFAEETKS